MKHERQVADGEAALAGAPGGDATPEPLAELLQAHQEDVRRFVNRAVRNREDAADVQQQIWLRVYRRWPGFRGENFRAWLFTIARHLIVDHYRAQRRFTFVDVSQAGLWDAEPALQLPSEVVQLAFENRERLHLCLRCVTSRLPVQGQVALLLADFYGFTDKESAAAVRLSLPSFKKLLHLSRSHLRAATHGACPHVASGDCPLLRPTELATAGTGTAKPPTASTGPTATTRPFPPAPDHEDATALRALRWELLSGLGWEHDPDRPGGQPFG